MKKFFTIFFCVLCVTSVVAEPSEVLRNSLNRWLATYKNEFVTPKKARIKSISVNDKKKTLSLYTNFAMSVSPFRPEIVQQLHDTIDSLSQNLFPGYKSIIYSVNGAKLESLIPRASRTGYELHALSPTNLQPEVFRIDLSQPFTISHGLQNRNIALWNSHGWYFDKHTGRWRWQRARYFETVEDKFTTSYVLQFLLPMLENAGANVWLPRERDVQTHEIIVDNDNDNINYDALYCESGDTKYYEDGPAGYWKSQNIYQRDETPFGAGTCRLLQTTPNEEAFVEWIPDVPEDGEYWVSVTYPYTASNATSAHYIVYHAGDTSEVVVNQTMACGTWVYLGKFYFKKGLNPDCGKVILSNQSQSSGVVVADAIRLGGGVGCIARGLSIEETEVSHRPRYLEAATYWLQLAGAPPSVYSQSEGTNDYTDDLTSRGMWVSWLNDGSDNAPSEPGLRVPIDLSFALHTDAGVCLDTVYGTLGIYSATSCKYTNYPNGQTRNISRDLTDYVATSVVADLRRSICPNWGFRGLWDKAYSETTRPNVPAMVLELLSHQNYTDMQFGLDPRFKFMACRAIYKGMLQFLSEQYGEKYVVQPLPVHGFAAQLVGDTVMLSWHATTDTLCDSATPNAYVVYTRIDGGGFDNGVLVQDSSYRLAIEPDKIYSFKVVAVNDGGSSFPSEILSACHNSKANHTVLVVNGFERVSAPEGFLTKDLGGFPDWLDDAEPYISDISYVGAQNEFRISEPWRDDDDPGFGASNSNFETRIVAGNTFDYPFVHGQALRAAGYSFTSCSAQAVELADVSMSDYRAVDWILGEQKQCHFGNDTSRWDFKIFSPINENRITDYCLQGGAFFVSGAYIGSDLMIGTSTEVDRDFAKNVLKYSWRTKRATQDGQVHGLATHDCHIKGNFEFCQTLNEKQYCVESPDGIEPAADAKAQSVMHYTQNGISAAVAYKGFYRTFVCGFPFESIKTAEQRNQFMQQVMEFLVKE